MNNEGKIFEKQWRESCKNSEVFWYKITDNYIINQQNGQPTQLNCFDGYLFYEGKLYCIELKSTDKNSMSVQLEPDGVGMVKLH